MNFMNDIYCFVHRTSTVANEFVSSPKLEVQPFAYFFQQDYNLILTKTSKISKIITKKYEVTLVKLYQKRKNFKRYFINLLPNDFIAQQQEQVMRKALGYSIDFLLSSKDKKKITKKEETSVKKPK